MSRWKAASIHLSISLGLGLLAGLLLLGLWYPSPFFHAAGADELVLLLVGIDLALGPLLTLIVFRSGKRGLRFDLAVIGCLQAAALIYGLTVISRSRPVFLVGAVDRFTLVSANDIDASDLAKASSAEFRSLSWTGARLVGAALPTAIEERNTLIFSGAGGKDIESMPQYYVDYTAVAAELLRRAKPLDALPNLDANARAKLDAALTNVKHEKGNVVWLPLVARRNDLVMLLDKDNGAPLRAVALAPWNSP